MRKYFGMGLAGLFCALMLCLVENAQAQATPGKPVIEWHFSGEAGFEGVTNLATLKQIWSLPESQALRVEASQRLALLASTHFSHGQTNHEIASQIAPLIEDLLRNEAKFELRGKSTNDNHWVLGIRLAPARAELWSTNLWKLASATQMSPSSGGGEGWTARLNQQGYGIKLSSHEGWTVIEGGFGEAVDTGAFLKNSALEASSGSETVLTARFDLAAMNAVLGLGRFAKGPEVSLMLEPKGTGLKTEISLKFPEDLGIKPEKWNVPVHTISDPLIGFTAIQGIEALIRKIDWIQKLNLQRMPNQLFIWSRGLTEFSEYWAADVGDPQKTVHTLVDTTIPRLTEKYKGVLLGNIEYNTNLNSVAWLGLPVVVPFVRPAPAPDSHFLTGGFFPTQEAKTNPPPAELLAQIDEKNLIYYDWEITQERLTHIHPLWQLSFIVSDRPLPDENGPAGKWLRAIGPKLGNTITVVTTPAPNELKLVRRSHIGFTALELTLLAHSFDPDTTEKQPHPAPRKAQMKATPPVKRPVPGPAPARAPRPSKPVTGPKP